MPWRGRRGRARAGGARRARAWARPARCRGRPGSARSRPRPRPGSRPRRCGRRGSRRSWCAHAPNLDAPASEVVCHDARMTTEDHPDPQRHEDTDAFRGATFRRVDLSGASLREVDLSGATIRDSDVTGLRIVASLVDDVHLSGHEGVGRVVVDDVDVSAYVSGRARPPPPRAGADPRDALGRRRARRLGGRERDVGRRGRPRRDRARAAAGRAGRGRVVVPRDGAPPRLRRRHLGRADAERRAGPVPPARGATHRHHGCRCRRDGPDPRPPGRRSTRSWPCTASAAAASPTCSCASPTPTCPGCAPPCSPRTGARSRSRCWSASPSWCASTPTTCGSRSATWRRSRQRSAPA